MINPATMMKLMAAKNTFTANHPKFTPFLKAVFMRGEESVPAGTVIEITVTKPGQAPIATNLKITESDLELMNTIKELAGQNQ
ncbi:MAG: hypothetical protein J6033_01935 [Lachnospiraceae bacterium]|nr:hypothetical protein [Lachnospiraceae bacterium]